MSCFYLKLLIAVALFHYSVAMEMEHGTPGCSYLALAEGGGLFDCQEVRVQDVKQEMLLSGAAVTYLRVSRLSPAAKLLPAHFIATNTSIRRLHIERSGLHHLHPDSLRGGANALVSLELPSNQLSNVPRLILHGLHRLRQLDLRENSLRQLLGHQFRGLALSVINVNGNFLTKVDPLAFSGLEDTLIELNIADNLLHSVPASALRHLKALNRLNLSGNQISRLDGEGVARWRLASVETLELYRNQLETLHALAFTMFPALRKLSLHTNRLFLVEKGALDGLQHLRTLDLSKNRLKSLPSNLLFDCRRLQVLDLSANHLHRIPTDLVSGKSRLQELILSENNLLELNHGDLSGCSSLSVLHLENNAIRRVSPGSLASLSNLTQLRMSGNQLRSLPAGVFRGCRQLKTLSLDRNLLSDMPPGLFSGLAHIQSLRLQINKLREIYAQDLVHLQSLQELHLHYNDLRRVSPIAFGSLRRLVDLNLRGNARIQIDALQKLPEGMISIQLDGCGLDHMPPAVANLSRLEILSLRHNIITSLNYSNLDNAVKLRYLYLQHNRITNIASYTFSGCHSLFSLVLTGNQITSIEPSLFAGLQNLHFLDVSENRIAQVTFNAFESLHSMLVLNMSYNPLGVIEKEMFASELPLKKLLLQGCALIHIENGSFHHLSQLSELDIRDNMLQRFDYVLSLTVDHLRISFNGAATWSDVQCFPWVNPISIDMEGLNLSNFPHYLTCANSELRGLKLGMNRVIAVNFTALANFDSLEELNLDKNRVSNVTFPYLANLRTVNLRENTISGLKEGAFRLLTKLRFIDLSFNRISNISPAVFAKNLHLHTLLLHHNQLQHLSQHCLESVSIQTLDLASNRLRTIPEAVTGGSMTAIRSLNVSDNPLLELLSASQRRHSGDISLQRLVACHIPMMNIASRDLAHLPSLRLLRLCHGRVSRIGPGAFSRLPRLTTLDLSHNQIEYLPRERLRGLTELRHLSLEHNFLQKPPHFSRDMSDLRRLDLSHNRLNELPGGSLSQLRELRSLSVSNNGLRQLEGRSLRGLLWLRRLDLSENVLEKIPMHLLRDVEATLSSLHISGNRFRCTCEISSLLSWLMNHPKLSRTDDLICWTPERLRGRSLENALQELSCASLTKPRIAIQDIQPRSVLVSWHSRQRHHLFGYSISYRLSNTSGTSTGNVSSTLAPASRRTHRLSQLTPNTTYIVCVRALLKESQQDDVNRTRLQYSAPSALLERSGTFHKDSGMAGTTQNLTGVQAGLRRTGLDVRHADLEGSGVARFQCVSVQTLAPQLRPRLRTWQLVIVAVISGTVLVFMLVCSARFCLVRQRRSERHLMRCFASVDNSCDDGDVGTVPGKRHPATSTSGAYSRHVGQPRL